MKELLVSIERGGERIPVGFIRGEGSADARFAYSDTWLCDPASAPISLSLPLQEAPFTPAQTKAYFDGLLPEGFTRSTVAQWMHVDDGDYLSILHGLGRECLGALCITEEGEDPQASYEKITRQDVKLHTSAPLFHDYPRFCLNCTTDLLLKAEPLYDDNAPAGDVPEMVQLPPVFFVIFAF